MEQIKEQLSDLRELAINHARLFQLECRQERDIAGRRFQAIGAGVLLLAIGALFFEASVMGWLLEKRVSFSFSAALMGVFNAGSAFVLLACFGKRNKLDGSPFAMTKAEFGRTAQWIENIFLTGEMKSAGK